MPKSEPLVILKDTREPRDCYLWKSEFWKERVVLIRKKLDCGDYTVQGHEPELVVERKTKSDYVASIINDTKNNDMRRDRFEAMWQRCIPGSWRWLLLEGEHVMAQLFEAEYQSKTHEHSVLGTLISWQERYKYNIMPVDDSVMGQKAVVWIIKEFLRGQAKRTKVAAEALTGRRGTK